MTNRSAIGGSVTLVTSDEMGPQVEAPLAKDGVDPRKDDPDPPTDPNLRASWTFANPVTAMTALVNPQGVTRLYVACGRQVFIVKVF